MGHSCSTCSCFDPCPRFNQDLTTSRTQAAEAEAGDLWYTPTREALDEAAEIIDQTSKGADLRSVLLAQDRGLSISNSGFFSPHAGKKDASLMFVLTDLDPDDCMAIAQLSQLHIEMETGIGEPLVIFNTRESTTSGQELEKKLLIAELSLGFSKYWILPPSKEYLEAKLSNSASDTSMRSHSPVNEQRLKKLKEERESTLADICDQLSRFPGESIYLYIFAPGHGNLTAIIENLKKRNEWPLKAKWHVSLYSGSFNMRGMTQNDFRALEDIMRCSDAPLVDIAKYAFFGGAKAHPWTDAFTTFAMKDFATCISSGWPLLAAALKLYNDENNERLIHPNHAGLFKGSRLSVEEQARFDNISALYTPGDMDSIQAYAEALHKDEELFAKVAGFKKSTIKAFASGGCDSPLCDQLVFLHAWLEVYRPYYVSHVKGRWNYNDKMGFTTIDPTDFSGIQAIQPSLVSPWNETSLMKMREQLFFYFRMHLDKLSSANRSSLANMTIVNREALTQHFVSQNAHIDSEALNRLSKMLDPTWSDDLVALVLAAICNKQRDIRALLEVIESVFGQVQMREFVNGLKKIEKLLMQLTESESTTRAEATWVLGEEAARDDTLAKQVGLILMQILFSDKQCRAEAAKALGKVKTLDSSLSEAIAVSLQKALEFDDVNCYREALRSLGKFGAEDRLPIRQLLHTLQIDTVPERQQIAVNMLGKVAAEHQSFATQIMPPLIEALNDSTVAKSQVQATAAQALGELGSSNKNVAEEAGRALLKIEFSSRKSVDFRINAIHALRKLVEIQPKLHKDVVSLLKVLFGDVQPWKVRVAAVKALGALGEHALVSEALSSSDNDDTRICAAIALGKLVLAKNLPRSAHIAQLRRSLQADARSKVQRCCAQALRLLGEEDDVIASKIAGSSEDEYILSEPIRKALDGDDTVLSKGSWMLAWCRHPHKRILPRLQDMPKEAIWNVGELMDRVEHHEKPVQIVAISYCWQTAEHPDPERDQLLKISRIIDQLLVTSPYDDYYGIDDLAIFLDYCSIPQVPRTQEEDKAFFRALGSINIWYGHKMTMVWLMTVVPSELPAYFDRGWPVFERAISELVSHFDDVLDMGKVNSYCVYWGDRRQRGTHWRCKAGRQAPIIPKVFNDELLNKRFTDSSDHQFVMDKYKQTFEEVMGSARTLSYGGLCWGNKEAKHVASSLSFCRNLWDLYMDRNKIGNPGAKALAGAIPTCTCLKKLWLGGNMISDDGLIALADAIASCHGLENLGLFQNSIGDAGAQALARVLGKCGKLSGLGLAENQIGNSGAVALSKVLPLCKLLTFFDISRNVIDDEGVLALAHCLLQTKLRVFMVGGNGHGLAAAKELEKLLSQCPTLTDECKRNTPSTL